MVIAIGMQSLGIEYTLDHANGAEEGLELWERAPYDIVLSDYNLRGMNGLKLIERLRKENPSIPTVLFTAYDSPQTHREASAAHVSAYIAKPFLVDEFVATVRGLLNIAPSQNSAPTLKATQRSL
jgi:CheY-like chemotaxis protein